ncbi:hypothetical protein [Dolosigranulum pigrum]|jgi:hypothetical protein|uniref:hypothetical protein n=1 Tax=Dolosigranulum pigrum TaxID=29394 RepID=UPI0011733FAD|nr:hypothetical protein [Dolosigranulum pigrum]VTU65549.1 hypothetical protein [Lactobacillus buchneri NRRL B-30929] [Dolosigranulum pigrum]
MMEKADWARAELAKRAEASQNYTQKAFYLEASALIEELVLRCQQNQGELDGTLWSPEEWED